MMGEIAPPGRDADGAMIHAYATGILNATMLIAFAALMILPPVASDTAFHEHAQHSSKMLRRLTLTCH